ncbi:MAG: organomercurial lyase [Geodermatophilaceae bacterium]
MSIDATHLATRLTQAISAHSAATGNPMSWLWAPLLRSLARGRPVAVEDLAQATGRSPAEVRDGLAGLADTEYDDLGRVVGHGITLRPTPHQFTVDGQRLYTWCALDTLIFPTVLGQAATVASPTPGTGELVRLAVDPAAGVTELDPATAVVSVLIPETSCQGCGRRSATRCTSSPPPKPPRTGSPSILAAPFRQWPDEAFDPGRRLAQDLPGDHPAHS